MRIGTLNHRYHALAGNLALDIADASDGRFAPDGFDIFERWGELAGWVSNVPDSAYRPFDTDALGPPVPMPRQAFGIGLNYRDHAAESGLAEPEVPLVFTKFPTSITGPSATVTLPSAYVDWEAELVAVIGAPRAARQGSRCVVACRRFDGGARPFRATRATRWSRTTIQPRKVLPGIRADRARDRHFGRDRCRRQP